MSRNKKSGGLGKGLEALFQTPQETRETSEININEVKPNPNQPRQVFAEDALSTLEESIKQYGLVQPIVVRKVDDYYQIVAGERRWRACKAIGMETIPAIIKTYSTEEMTEIALVENLQRQDLDPVEESMAYDRLMKVFKLTQESVAHKVGRSRSHVANMLRLLALPEFVKYDLSLGEVTIGQVRPLLSLKSEDQQRYALEKIKELELSARQVEVLVKQLSTAKLKATKVVRETAEIRAFENRLKLALGTAVGIKIKAGKGVKGKIEIPFASEKELERLMAFFDEEASSSEEVEEAIPFRI